MESLTLLIYGTNIAPHKHLHKLANKYINQYMKVRHTAYFTVADYYEVIVEEQSLHSGQRQYLTAPIIPIHKNYLPNLLNVYGDLNATVKLCTVDHEHPVVYVNDCEYEGYCYYELNTDNKILFFEVLGTRYGVSLSKHSSSDQMMEEFIKRHLKALDINNESI